MLHEQYTGFRQIRNKMNHSKTYISIILFGNNTDIFKNILFYIASYIYISQDNQNSDLVGLVISWGSLNNNSRFSLISSPCGEGSNPVGYTPKVS